MSKAARNDKFCWRPGDLVVEPPAKLKHSPGGKPHDQASHGRRGGAAGAGARPARVPTESEFLAGEIFRSEYAGDPGFPVFTSTEDFPPVKPGHERVYHGTTISAVPGIRESGIVAGSRIGRGEEIGAVMGTTQKPSKFGSIVYVADLPQKIVHHVNDDWVEVPEIPTSAIRGIYVGGMSTRNVDVLMRGIQRYQELYGGKKEAGSRPAPRRWGTRYKHTPGGKPHDQSRHGARGGATAGEGVDENISFMGTDYADRTNRAFETEFLPRCVENYKLNHPGEDITPHEYEERCNAFIRGEMEGANIAVRLSEENLARVLEKGAYLSVFESGGSSTPTFQEAKNKYLKLRRDFEEEVFDMPAKQKTGRPVYGYFTKDPDGRQDSRSLQEYGDVTVVLHENVRKRTTFTDGDSLDDAWFDRHHRSPKLDADGKPVTKTDVWGEQRPVIEDWKSGSAIPTPANKPSLRSSMWPCRHEDILTWYQDIQSGRLKRGTSSFEMDGNYSYWEAQIHGGFKTSDIREIIFKRQPSEATIAKLVASGMNWRVANANR